MKFTLDENGVYRPSDAGDVDLVSSEDGIIRISGLHGTNFTLEEIVAPEGYELPPQQENRRWSIEFNATSDHFDVTTLTYSTTITNKLSTYELPETGNAGTKIYTAAGTILLMTGTGLYRYKRRGKRKGGETH